MFKIPRSVLERQYKKEDIKRQEGQLALGERLENPLLSVLCFVRYGAILWTNLISAASLKLLRQERHSAQMF